MRDASASGEADAVGAAGQGALPLGQSLVLDGVSRRYGAAHGVEALSLSIAPGEFITLLGPSGSGKTTTLKMVAGFELPDTGSIRLGGRDITELAPHRRGIGMVFQTYALFPHMSVAENVAFPLRMRRRPRDETAAAVRRMLDLVHLADHADRHPRQLSGGQQQRVALARALIFSPPLLLMDEPLGALDRQLRRQVQSEIKRIQRRLGITVLFVTHDQEEALFLSDRIAVMHEGRIAQVGAPAALYAEPANRFVAEFLGEPNVLKGRAAGETSVLLSDGATLPGRAMAALGPGQRVEVLVRPERIRLGRPAAGEQRMAGRVELVNFLGETVEIEARTGAGDALRVRLAFRSGLVLPAPGEVVDFHVDPLDCLIFPAEPGQARDRP